MSLIQCDELCHFQKDGWCRLEVPSTVSNGKSKCVYFKPNLTDNTNSLFKASDTDKF